MSKVICDICGTSYSEMSTQCPICGSARRGEPSTSGTSAQENGGYTHVKGGRFSKSNVKKRTHGAAGGSSQKESADKKSTGLIIILIALILIVLSIIFVVIHSMNSNDSDPAINQQTEPQVIACESITLNQIPEPFDAVGQSLLLSVSVLPANTTDTLSFTSDNTAVAVVNEKGMVTCEGEGSATITIRCGDQETTCVISCVIPTEEQPPTVLPEGIHLNRMSITADFEGFEWTLYSGKVSVDEIEWSSDNPEVATFVNGIVTAVGEGETDVHADYNGVRSSCHIICDFDLEEEMQGGEQPPEVTGELVIYSQYGNALSFNEDLQAYDVMISVNESVGLFLKDSNGVSVDVIWTIVEGDSCTIEDNYVTAHSSKTNCMVEAEYEGATYRCYIRTKD